MTMRPVTEARIWFLVAYRRYRQEGHNPLQAAQLCFGDALKCPDRTRREWRKFYAERYFNTIKVRATGPVMLHADYWKYGQTLEQATTTLRARITPPYPKRSL